MGKKLMPSIEKGLWLIVMPIFFICDVLVHPFEQMPVWIVLFLFLGINKTNTLNLNEVQMLAFAFGFVTLITFLITYLQSNTEDASEQSHYYLAVNKKRWDLHSNFWFKRLNEIPLKLFLWALILLPVFRMVLKHYYGLKDVNLLGIEIRQIYKVIDSAWIAIFAVAGTVFAALLIEALYLSRRRFSYSRSYSPKNLFIELQIKEELRRNFEETFRKLWKFPLVFHPKSRTYSFDSFRSMTEFYILSALENIDNAEELTVYLRIFYNIELSRMDEVYKKIEKHLHILCATDSWLPLPKIRKYMLKIYLENWKLYYFDKWRSLEPSLLFKRTPYFFVIVEQDLDRLLALEMLFHDRGKEIEEIYSSIFQVDWRLLKNPRLREGRDIGNVCFDSLLEIFENALKQGDVDHMKDLSCVMNRLMDVEKTFGKNSTNIYFDILFDRLLELVEVDEDKANRLLKDYTLGDTFGQIAKKWKACSLKKLLSGNELTDRQLEFSLRPLDLNEMAIALFFRLAYRNRAQQGNMPKAEVQIWRSNIRAFRFLDRDIGLLTRSPFEVELFDVIKKSPVSHFISKEFLLWIWDSLFNPFDQKKYAEFVHLSGEGVIRNFSTLDYLLFRRLLLGDFSEYRVYGQLNHMAKEELGVELRVVEDYFVN